MLIHYVAGETFFVKEANCQRSCMKFFIPCLAILPYILHFDRVFEVSALYSRWKFYVKLMYWQFFWCIYSMNYIIRENNMRIVGDVNTLWPYRYCNYTKPPDVIPAHFLSYFRIAVSKIFNCKFEVDYFQIYSCILPDWHSIPWQYYSSSLSNFSIKNMVCLGISLLPLKLSDVYWGLLMLYTPAHACITT